MKSIFTNVWEIVGVCAPILIISIGVTTWVNATSACEDSCGNLESTYRRSKCYCDGKLLRDGPARGAPRP